MKGREGKFYIQRQYDINYDRWDWFATCWVGDDWRVFQVGAYHPLSFVFDYVLMQAKEYHAEVSREKIESRIW